MFLRFLSPALFLALACRGKSEDRLTAADGKRHYTTYTAAGEVEDTKGLVNIYAATGPNALSAVAARAKPLVYVPNSRSGTVSVIDPSTYNVVRTFKTGRVPQH